MNDTTQLWRSKTLRRAWKFDHGMLTGGDLDRFPLDLEREGVRGRGWFLISAS